MSSLKLILSIVIFSVTVTPISYADKKQPTYIFNKCETHKDFMKIGEAITTEGSNKTNELIFLISPQRKVTGNTLGDSIGYFVHNTNKIKSHFIMVLWLEKQSACLIFDGLALHQKDPIEFFKKRNKALSILKLLENK